MPANTNIPSDRVHQGTPWLTIQEVMKAKDEAMLKSCREDVDTFLVFAGLFSAVVTYFLVELHRDLQTDTTDVLLAKILLEIQQKNSPGDNLLNRTIPDSPLQHDPHLLISKRLNTLWVASLIVSSITASLAILIKQWLQQYHIDEHVSPQRWLRKYFYRFSGATGWKLFELVYVLPLLLQLSLGLFLLGLCLFFSDEDTQVGLVGWILVSLWAFMISFVVINPVIYPSSPFKTPFLQSAIAPIRSFIYRTLPSWCSSYTSSIQQPIDAAMFVKRLRFNEESFEEEYFTDNASIHQDHEILHAIDATQGHDDTIVPYIMAALDDVEQRARLELVATPEIHTTSFLSRFIETRLDRGSLNLRVCRPDLHGQLSPRTWTLCVDKAAGLLTARLLSYQDRTQQFRWVGWMEEMMTLLLSRIEHELPVSGRQALALALEIDPTGSAQRICSRVPIPEWASQPGPSSTKLRTDIFSDLLSHELNGVIDFLSGQPLASAVFQLLRAQYLDTESQSFEEFFKLNPVNSALTRYPQGATPRQLYISLPGTLHPTLSLLLKSLDAPISATYDLAVRWHHDACSFVFRHEPYWIDDHSSHVQSWMIRRPNLDNCIQMAFPARSDDDILPEVLSSALHKVYNSMGPDDRQTMIQMVTNMLREHYILEAFTGESNVNIEYLRLARFLLQCARQEKHSKTMVRTWKKLYRALSTTLSLHIRHNNVSSNWKLVKECNELADHYSIPSVLTSTLSTEDRLARKVVSRLRNLVRSSTMS
ncbi:hypothetical protein QCA50_010097 [Cerrena zonata]|uniref:DUF6535 domain-containing protein n=1 Tax=Cerrena zonata TaxID=2478898 RepID=A0AAW0G8D0_9APHY